MVNMQNSGQHAYQGEQAKFAKCPNIFNAILQTPHAISAKVFGKRLCKDLAFDQTFNPEFLQL